MPDNFDRQKEEQRRRAEANMNGIHTEEYRICVRCNWQTTKSEAIRKGIKACPVCGCSHQAGASRGRRRIDARGARRAGNAEETEYSA